jgi:hypothetical protein
MTIASSSGLNEKDIEKMVSDAEQFAESDKERRSLIEEANKADSVCADTEKGKLFEVGLERILFLKNSLLAMGEFKDQLDAPEKEKVTKLIEELRELAKRGQASEADVTAEMIRVKINETQQASLGLFQKVRTLLFIPSPPLVTDGVGFLFFFLFLLWCRFMRSELRSKVPLHQTPLPPHRRSRDRQTPRLPRRRKTKKEPDGCSFPSPL